MSTASEIETLWLVEFRSFGAGDYHVPLMYIPVQRTFVLAASEDLARREVESSVCGRVVFLTVERAPEWMQPQE